MPESTTFKLTIAYDGTGLVGWQRQPEGTSIQGLLEDALTRLTATAGVTVTGAGRTDAGVHARGQVASTTLATRLAPADLQRGANAMLPPAVRVVAVEAVDATFHARSAREKRYAYHAILGPVISPFDARYAWHIPFPLGRRGDAGGAAGAARPPRFRRISVNRVRIYKTPCGRSARRGSTRNRRTAAPPGWSSRWPATASSATWSGPSPAAWSRSAAGAGRRTRMGGDPGRRRTRSQAPGRRRRRTACFLVSVRYC